MISATTRYRHLAQLAIDYLEQTGKPQSPQALAARLLGQSTAGLLAQASTPGANQSRGLAGAPAPASRSPFVRLVEDLLEGDTRFARDNSGNWGLVEWERAGGLRGAETPLAEALFAVLDVETTGGRAEQHRIVEVAVVTVQRGEITGYYESLVNPQRALPAFVSKLTGITQDMVESAPGAQAVLPEVRAMIGDGVVVGHNIGSDLSFLNYEALWHGLPPFGNPALDTEEVALRLLPHLRRPSLSRVASALGLTPPLRHRALADARLTAQVLQRLLGHLPETGDGEINTVGQLQDWLSGRLYSRVTGRQERVRQVRAALAPGMLGSLPEAPGVYTFSDAAGQALYVGKAASLRQRVAQHFSGTARALRRHDGLLERTASIAHEVAGCELDALLLESARIRSLQPPYNVQARSRQGCPFLRLELGPFPRAGAAQHIQSAAGDPHSPGDAQSSGLRYAGPYRTTQEVRHTIGTLRRVFQLRSCRRVLPAKRPEMRRPCLRLGQGLCPAPCAELITPQQYAVLVEYAWHFVTHGRAATLDALDARLTQIEIEAEGAAPGWEQLMLRECRSRLRRVRREYRPVEGGLGGDDLIMAYRAAGGGAILFFVHDGQLRRRLHVPPEALESRDEEDGHTPSALVALIESGRQNALAPPAGPLPSDGALDAHQGHILMRWIYRHSGDPECIPVTPDMPATELARAAALVLS